MLNKARRKYNSRCAAITTKFYAPLQEGITMATLPDLAEQIHEGLASALEELEVCFPETCTENLEELIPLVIELRERL